MTDRPALAEFLSIEAEQCQAMAARYTYKGNPARPETAAIAESNAHKRAFWLAKGLSLALAAGFLGRGT